MHPPARRGSVGTFAGRSLVHRLADGVQWQQRTGLDAQWTEIEALRGDIERLRPENTERRLLEALRLLAAENDRVVQREIELEKEAARAAHFRGEAERFRVLSLRLKAQLEAATAEGAAQRERADHAEDELRVATRRHLQTHIGALVEQRQLRAVVEDLEERRAVMVADMRTLRLRVRQLESLLVAKERQYNATREHLDVVKANLGASERQLQARDAQIRTMTKQVDLLFRAQQSAADKDSRALKEAIQATEMDASRSVQLMQKTIRVLATKLEVERETKSS